MLEVFLGGYLFHPAALDYSGDTCQNGCAYCFANINKEARAGNLKGAISALYKKEIRTYRDMLLPGVTTAPGILKQQRDQHEEIES